MFLADSPIRSCDELLPGRREFSESLAKAIWGYGSSECLVLGLYGEWGSGKTSIINCVERQLVRLSKENPRAGKVVFARFNPWNFSDQKPLIVQFFTHLSNVLGDQDRSKQAKEASQKLKTFARLFSAFSIVPVAGEVLGLLGSSFERLGGAFESLATDLSQDFQATKDKLCQHLVKRSGKIVIAIDDIDRLTSSEVRQIFQLVKSVADFPNTIYLLAFDKKVVIETLRDVQKGSPEDYLAKIVPVTFDVPLLDRDDLKALLEARLNAILEPDWPRKEWAGTYSWFMYGFFRNMRDVNRYANTLHFSYGILKNDVNLRDLMLITAIQVRAPVLYDAIRANKWLLAGVYRPSFLAHGFPEKEKLEKEGVRIEFEQLLEKSEGVASEYVRELIRQLFPKYEEIVDSKSHGDWDLREWALGRRICHPTFFDRYFRLSIPKGQLWQRDLDEIFTRAEEEESLSERLKALHQTGELGDLLRTLEHYDPKLITESRKKNIIKVLLKTGDSLCDSGKRPLGRVSEIMWVIDPLISSNADLDERFEVLKEATCSSESLYTLVWLIRYIRSLHKSRGLPPDVDTIREELESEHLMVRGKHFRELQNLVSEKILESVEEGRFLDHPHFGELVWAWAEWEAGDRVQEIVKKATSTRAGLLTFCGGFLKSWHNDELVDAVPGFVTNGITLALPLEEAEQRMLSIQRSADFDSLDERQRIVVEQVLGAIAAKKMGGDSDISANAEEHDSES